MQLSQSFIKSAPNVRDLKGSSQAYIVDTVQDWVANGKLGEGDALPPMRRLAEQFAVDKSTICRALSALQSAGVVRRQGRRLHVVRPGSASADSVDWTSGMVGVVTASDVTKAPPTAGWAGISPHVLAALHEGGRYAAVFRPEMVDDQPLRDLVNSNVAGFILTPVSDEALQDRWIGLLSEANVPFVLYGEEFGDERDPAQLNVVTLDHEDAAYQLSRWLIGRGCRRILRYWPHQHDRLHRPAWLKDRDRGHERAAREAGHELLPPVEFHRPIEKVSTPKQAFDARVRQAAGHLVEHLLAREPIDAIVTATDTHAFEVAAACRLFGKTPNKDVLITGFDGYWQTCEYRQHESVGPIVTVEQDLAMIGREMVRLLDKQIQAGSSMTPELVRLPAKLIETEESNA